ncbi:ferrochelatase [Pseudoxanthomonas broegbernensis]|uniref:Ferrochelatase n=1 Tax=Pseudoxanthomonas broegbernensis TaxID=83619 RepID=A0A7V8GNE5_9GAMM|nr:ferrochelatase [Pseudoxanthomonas broegbernensis]KAF1686927.1 ferrochelatase [Pseudoxanthomonas broegbernensis]MBB6065475.1 ferrochelatase [Pseudoxanthomonas broegbernensis]
MHEIADTALVAVNLGTPEAPTAPAVRRYLAEFLGDPRVVSIPPLLWKPLLHGLILPLRGPRSAANYAKVWMEEGSPLLVHTLRLASALQSRLPDWRVLPAMRYGQPALRATLRELRASGVRRLVVLPLYPQYSTTTTASVADLVAEETGGMDVTLIEDYSTDAGWVGAVADSVARFRDAHGEGDHLLFSFHGLPQRVADAGDPYPQRCQGSAGAVAAALGLEPARWSLSYQSRFGRERWLEPATQDELDRLADAGVRRLDVVCPGFAVDCIETLEEVALGLAERFAARGGSLRYIPCLNDADGHADALARLARCAAGSGKCGPDAR